jgi:hypothetical protein
LLWASPIRLVMQDISSCSKLSARVGTALVQVRPASLTLGFWNLNLLVNVEQWHLHPSLICGFWGLFSCIGWGGRINFAFIRGGHLAAYSLGERSWVSE